MSSVYLPQSALRATSMLCVKPLSSQAFFFSFVSDVYSNIPVVQQNIMDPFRSIISFEVTHWSAPFQAEFMNCSF